MGNKRRNSDSYIIAAILFFIGGFQNTYTYLNCEKIFANLQTGNMVLMSINLANGNYLLALRYLVPLTCFIIGCVVGIVVDIKLKNNNTIHWRSILLFIQLICVIIVGFIPDKYDLISAGIITFNSALSLEGFKTVNNNRTLPTTMMIGNMRKSVDYLVSYFMLHNKEDLKEFYNVFSLLLIFLFSCMMEAFINPLLNLKSIFILIPLYIFAIIYIEIDKD